MAHDRSALEISATRPREAMQENRKIDEHSDSDNAALGSLLEFIDLAGWKDGSDMDRRNRSG
jgi:hypothetical protein